MAEMQEFAISVEMWREYDVMVRVAPGEYITRTIRIENPVRLYITDSGSHRVVDEDGVVHRIPANFIALRWKVHPGYPEVSF